MQKIEVIIQEHKAKRAGLHYDIRLVDPASKDAASMVTRRKDIFPAISGQKYFWPITTLHSYGAAEFEGHIAEGYGAGDVKVVRRFTVDTDFFIEKKAGLAYPEKFHMKIPKEGNFVFIKSMYRGSDGYLVMKKDELSGIASDTRTQDITYKALDPNTADAEVLFKDSRYGMMEKLDGAGVKVVVTGGKMGILSNRPSVTGTAIIENPKVKHLDELEVPKELEGQVFRGELYRKNESGKSDFRETSRVLLSGPDKAEKIQAEKGPSGRMHLAVFGYLGERDKATGNIVKKDKESYIQERKKIEQFVNMVRSPYVHIPELVTTEETKGKLFAQANEGVIAVAPELPLSKVNPMIKLKKRQDLNLRVIGYTEGEGEFTNTMGALILTDRNGKVNVMVGTGFTKSMRDDIYSNFHKYKGRIAKVAYLPGYDQGLRAPSFLGFETLGALPDYYSERGN